MAKTWRYAPLTKKERNAIRTLKGLAKRWPKSLWLFSASGTLNVMRKDEGGETVETPYGGSDPAFSICDIDIQNDGGDW